MSETSSWECGETSSWHRWTHTLAPLDPAVNDSGLFRHDQSGCAPAIKKLAAGGPAVTEPVRPAEPAPDQRNHLPREQLNDPRQGPVPAGAPAGTGLVDGVRILSQESAAMMCQA